MPVPAGPSRRRWTVWVLAAAVAGLAAWSFALVAASDVTVGAPLRLAFWHLAIAFVATELLVVSPPFRGGTHRFTLSEIPLVLGLFLAAPDDLFAARLLGTAIALLVTTGVRRRPARFAFVLALSAAETMAAIGVFRLVDRPDIGLGPRDVAAALLAMAAATAVVSTLIQAEAALGDGRLLRPATRRTALLGGVVVLANTSVALAGVGLVWAEPSFGVLVVPLAVVLLLGYRAYAAAKRRHDALELLYEGSRLLHGASTFEPGLEALLVRARAAFGAELAIATLFPTSEGALRTAIGAADDLAIVHRVDGDAIDPLSRQALAEGRAVRASAVTRGEALLRIAEVDVCDAMAAPLRGEHGVIGTIAVANRRGDGVGFARDDLKLFDLLASHAGVTLENMRLDRELAQLTQLLSERRRLEENLRGMQKLEAVGQLAGGVAHEFNNLLTAIGGYSELLLSTLEGDERAHAEEIAAASARAARLTSQLLAFGRKQVSRPVVLEPNEMILQLEGMLRPVLGEPIELRIELDPKLVDVRIDPDLLKEAVLNLAFNARDAMSGGGTLTIRTETVLVGIDSPGDVAMHPGAYALLSVIDTGRGMDEATRARAFEPFFTTKAVGEGTGLGLASVYGIVKQSGGYIFARSEPGAGTRLDIYLPAAAQSEEAAPDPHPRILLVEDEPAVRGVIRAMLEQAAFDVVEAGDGEEALSVAASLDVDIDLLVTDAVMPGISGSELYALLSAARPELRVLYMSGYPSGSMAAYEVDPSKPFIQKPFSAAALVERAQEVLDPDLELATA